MFRVAVLVSGGGTNLQAIIDRVKDGSLPGVGIVRVISNNAGAYALTRAKNAGIEGVTVSPKEYETRELFNKALLRAVKEASPTLSSLPVFL